MVVRSTGLRSVRRLAVATLLIGALVALAPAPPAQAATLTVDTTVDEFGSGAGCGLREAIQASNTDAPFGGCPAGSGGDVIVLGTGLTYDLTRCGTDDDNSAGDLDVLDATLTLNGGGSTIRQTCDAARVVQHNTAGNLTLNNVVVTGGNGEAGTGVDTAGALSGDGLTVIDNPGNGAGSAGINTDGSVTLTNATVSNNSTSGDLCCAGVNAGADVSLTDSVVSNNTTESACCTGVIADNIDLVRTVVEGNSTGGDCCAGAIGANINLVDSAVVNNDSPDECCVGVVGDAITLVNSYVNDNDAGQCCAGAIGDEIALLNSEVVNNSSTGECCVGVIGDDITMIGSTVSMNRIGDVDLGACCLGVVGDNIRAVNSTISFNVNAGPDDCCNGVIASGSLELLYVTIAGNRSGDGGATVSGDTLESYGSLLTGEGQVCDIASGTTSLGYNLVGDDTCGLDDPTDGPVDDPLLGPLADNGGPTRTHLPLDGSPLIDNIPTADCFPDVNVDQRGVTRPQFGGCDTGSVEVAPEPPPPEPTPPTSGGVGSDTDEVVTPRFTG